MENSSSSVRHHDRSDPHSMASRGGGRGRGGAAGANRGGKSSNYRDCDGQRSQGEVWEEELTFFFLMQAVEASSNLLARQPKF